MIRRAETAVGLTGPQADEVLERMGLAGACGADDFDQRASGTAWICGFCALTAWWSPHYEIWTPVARVDSALAHALDCGGQPGWFGSAEKLRIAEGIPAYGIDIAERDLPQETSQMRALHFSKGCYLGQEIVERIRSRGNVHRHLRHLELDGILPPAGTELTVDGVVAGQITSAAEILLAKGSRRFAMGMIRGEAEAKNRPLAYSVECGSREPREFLREPPRL